MADLLIWVFLALGALGAAAIGLALAVWLVAVLRYWLLAALVLVAAALAWPWAQSLGYEEWVILAAFVAVGLGVAVDATLLK